VIKGPEQGASEGKKMKKSNVSCSALKRGHFHQLERKEGGRSPVHSSWIEHVFRSEVRKL